MRTAATASRDGSRVGACWTRVASIDAVVFGLDRGGEVVDRLDDHFRVFDREQPLSLGGGGRFEDRLEYFAGEAAPRTEVSRGPNPGPRLTRAELYQVHEQHGQVRYAQFGRDPPIGQFRDQRVIDHGEPAPLHLDRLHQVEQLVTAQPDQINIEQFVDPGAQHPGRVERRGHRRVEHVFHYARYRPCKQPLTGLNLL